MATKHSAVRMLGDKYAFLNLTLSWYPYKTSKCSPRRLSNSPNSLAYNPTCTLTSQEKGKNSISTIMLMNRALSMMKLKPLPNTMKMKAAQTFQTAHIDPDFVFFEADGAFGVVDTVFFRRSVREYACSPHGTEGLGTPEDNGCVCLFASCSTGFGGIRDWNDGCGGR
jgi:hypothetical protein